MAEAPPKAAGSAPKKGGGKFKFFFFMVVIGLSMPFFLPTIMIVLVGLVPTYVAFMTDSDPQKSGATSVGALNFAGLTPFIIDLWHKGHTPAAAVHILSDMNSWLVILGAAAIGQMIVSTIPPAIATLTLTHADTRIKALRKNLDLLKEAWGPEVATTKPLDQIIKE